MPGESVPQGLWLPPRVATLVVAAINSTDRDRAQADYLCDSINDHIEIQAALDALPVTGGEVKLLDGTYYIEVSLALDSYQTLRGQGRNTILTTTTANLDIITATGGDGSEKVGILIADLCVDGNAGGVANDVGILWTYVDYSAIINVWAQNNAEPGIKLITCDFNEIAGNISQGSGTLGNPGIQLDNSDNNTVTGNTVTGSHGASIQLDTSDYNTVTGNTCQGSTSTDGVQLDNSDYNTIAGNTCQGNAREGIRLWDSSNNNTVTGNTVTGNGASGILLNASDNNTVTGNTCQGNSNNGIALDNSDYNTVTGNTCQGNTTYRGIQLSTSCYNTIAGNTCQGNAREGIYLWSSSHNNTISGNTCTGNSQGADNTYDNIYLEESDYNLIEGNLCRAPTIGTTLDVGEPITETEISVTNVAGFEVGMGVVIDLGGANEEYHWIIAISGAAPGVITIDAGLTAAQGAATTIDVPEARYGINIVADTCIKNVIIGNDLYDSGKTANFNDLGALTMVRDDNRDIDVIQVRHYIYVKNTSGTQRVAGDVVIIKGIATAVEFTTTTTQGDDKVYGMVAETIEDDAYGYVLVKGFTAALKVDGTIDIAIDDILGTFTTVCIAMKAAAGDQGFALALEGYTTDDSSGVINAYLRSPWD